MQLKGLIPIVLAFALALSGCNLFRSADEAAQQSAADVGVEPDADAPDLGDNNANNLTDTGDGSTDAALEIPDLPREEFETDDPVVAPRSRVTDDLIALWLFDEGSGSVIRDVSGVEPALDLTLEGDATWASSLGSLTFEDARASAMSPDKIYDRWLESQRMTVEFWARSTNAFQDGPTRLLTLSNDSSERNFTIGFENTQVHIRMRGDRTSVDNEFNNGGPYLMPSEILDLGVRHWAMTFDGWKVRLYRDAELVYTATRPTSLDSWDRSYDLAIGDEFVDSRNLEAEVFLVALYDRALKDDEISRNFEAGLSVDADDASVPPELR